MASIGNDLISVIIPVFNTEAYIKDCLNSIVGQTYQNLEVIVIDDGSTDQSPLICDQYATAYPYIQVIHQPNQGLSAARNAGLNRIHGEWVIFVDSDDYIHPDMIQVLYHTAHSKAVSLVRCDYQKTTAGLEEIRWQVPESIDSVKVRQVQTIDEMKDMLKGTKLSIVWAAIFHKTIVENLRFMEGYDYEDVAFMAEIIEKIRIFCWVDAKYSAYRQVQTSITRKEISIKSIDLCYMMERRIILIRESFPELQFLAEEKFWRITTNLYNQFLNLGKTIEANILLQDVKKRYLPELLSWALICNRNITIHRRILLAGCKISFPLTCRIKNKIINLYETWFSLMHKKTRPWY